MFLLVDMPHRWNSEREVLVFLASIVACVLLALSSTGKTWTRTAMNAVADVMSWVEIPADLAIKGTSNFRRWTVERRELLIELARLREENRAMRLALGKNETDKIASDTKRSNDFQIIYRDPHLWWDYVRIRTGPVKVAQGSAVLDGSDLVGVVTSCDSASAWVHLITSAKFYAPVILEQTREIGVVTGDGNGGVWLRYIPDGDYEAGTKILTAMGGGLPEGLPVGVLTGEKRPYMPGIAEYRVKTGADIFRLQYVFAAGGQQ